MKSRIPDQGVGAIGAFRCRQAKAGTSLEKRLAKTDGRAVSQSTFNKNPRAKQRPGVKQTAVKPGVKS